MRADNFGGKHKVISTETLFKISHSGLQDWKSSCVYTKSALTNSKSLLRWSWSVYHLKFGLFSLSLVYFFKTSLENEKPFISRSNSVERTSKTSFLSIKYETASIRALRSKLKTLSRKLLWNRCHFGLGREVSLSITQVVNALMNSIVRSIN